MKKNAIFILVLISSILILLNNVSATDVNSTDVDCSVSNADVSISSDDSLNVISEHEAVNSDDSLNVISEHEAVSSGSTQHVISKYNYTQYFDGFGNLDSAAVKNGDTLILSGEFDNKHFNINRPVNIVGNNSIIREGYLYITSSDVNVSNIRIINNNSPGLILYRALNCNIWNNSIVTYGAFASIVNPGSKYNNISNNYFKSGTVSGKSYSTMVLGGADYNYIANNYLECDNANIIYISIWGSGAFHGGEANFNIFYNNTLKCMIDNPDAFCYGMQMMGFNNTIDSNVIIGTFRGISTYENSTVINNKIFNLTGVAYLSADRIGADYGIFVGDNCLVSNNTIANCLISSSAIYCGSNSIISNNNIDITGDGYGIYADGDNINVLNNIVSTVGKASIYQTGNLTGLTLYGNIINSSSGVGILLVKSSNSKYPSNVSVINNIVVMSSKYSINIKDVDKNSYNISDNKCYGIILTPDSEISHGNGSYTIYNVYGSFDNLTEAINSIVDGGVINLIGNIKLISSDYYLRSGIVIDKNVTILGNNFQINANKFNTRIFNITSTGSLVLRNAVVLGANLLFSDLHSEDIKGIEKEYSGGAIFNSGNLTVIDSSFIHNNANLGGVIYNEGVATLINSNFRDNKAVSVNPYKWDDYGNSLEDDTILVFPEEGGCAGAIYNDGYLTVIDCYFFGNDAERSSGVIFNNGFLNVSNSEFLSNKASGPAAFCGAIYANSTTILKESNFHSTQASSGGVINSNNANLTIEDCNIHNNIAYYDHWGSQGGVIFSSGGNIDLINTNFTANSAGASAGVIEIYDIRGKANTNLSITGCNFDDNYGGSNGVIDMFSSGKLYIENSSFTRNKGGLEVSVINNRGGADMTIIDSVVKNNNAVGGISNVAATIYSNGANNVISGSVFDNNKGSNGGALWVTGKTIVSGSNFTNNKAIIDGGAIKNTGSLTIIDSYFIGNKGNGNAIHTYNRFKPNELIDNGYFDKDGKYHVIIIKPTEPVVPSNPDVPTKPDVPSKPEVPTKPDVPSNPNVPVTPSNPSQGGNTGGESKGNTSADNVTGDGNGTSSENPVNGNTSSEIVDVVIDVVSNGSSISSDLDGHFAVGVSDIIFTGVDSAVSSPSSSSSSSSSSSIGESSSNEQGSESKSYEVSKRVNKSAISTNNIIVTIVVILLVAILIGLGYYRNKKNEI